MIKPLGKMTFQADVARIRAAINQTTAPAGAVDHGALAGLGDDDHSQYVHLTANRVITAQHQFAPAGAQPPFTLGANAQGQTVTGLRADELNKSILAGDGLSGGGALTADRTLSLASTTAGAGLTFTTGVLAVGAGDGIDVLADSVAVDVTDIIGVGLTEDGGNNLVIGTPSTVTVASTNTVSGTTHNHAITTSSNPGAAAAILASSAAGALTLVNFGVSGNITSSLIPSLVDTYDLGSSTLLWRKGYLSEMDALLFAENTITLLGGWFYVPKDAGTFAADVAAANTSIDFGKAMTVGDFVVMRASLKVEYVQVGSLVSGTRYNVTRNLDGSGANDWPAGTPFCVLGTTGDGRIELNAYDTPRISIIEQGATYNAQTERIRIGDMTGVFGTGANHRYGIGIGDYSGGNYISYNAEAAGTFKILAGGGEVSIDANGINFLGNASGTTWLAWRDPSNILSHFEGYKTGSTGNDLYISVDSLAGITQARMRMVVSAPTNALKIWEASAGVASFHIEADENASPVSYAEVAAYEIDLTSQFTDINIYARIGTGVVIGSLTQTPNVQDLNVLGGIMAGHISTDPAAGDVWATTDGRFGGGLYVGSTANDPPVDDIIADGGIYLGRNADPGAGNVAYAGALKSYKNATEYTGYIFVPLANNTYLTSTAWDGDAYSTTAKTLIDLSAVFGAPAGIQAVLLQVIIQDSGAGATASRIRFADVATADVGPSMDCPPANDRQARGMMIIPCDANGDIYYQITASGAGTMDVFVQIWGYWI